MNIDEDYVSEINKIVNNNIVTQFDRKTNFERRKNINADLYNIINNIAIMKNYIRLRAFKFFVNTIYNKINVNRFILYYFKCYKNSKFFIKLYIEL